MPVFRYKAVNASGAVAVGELDAANESEIVDRLRDQGLMPMQVARAAAGAVGGSGAARRPPAHAARAAAGSPPRRSRRDNVLAITRELATLLRAGLPLDRALEILIGLADTPPVVDAAAGHSRRRARRQVAVAGARRAARGVLALLRQHHPRGRGGRRARHRADRASPTRWSATRSCARASISALIYPTILIGVAVLSLMLILAYVVPQFEQTFAQAGKALPLPTQVVIFVGTGVKQWWWAIAAFVGALRRCGCAAGCAIPSCAGAGTRACCAGR